MDFGGRLSEDGIAVRRISIESFRGDGVPVAVEHPITWMGLRYSGPKSADETVDRALWLVHHQPPRYRLGYRNCESIAIWCATGDYESFQVKRVMLWKSLADVSIPYLLRKKPDLVIKVRVASLVFSLFTAIPYIHDKRLFDHTRQYPGIGNWTC